MDEDNLNSVLNLAISRKASYYYSRAASFHNIMEKVWLVASAGCTAAMFFVPNPLLLLLILLYLGVSFLCNREKEKSLAKAEASMDFYERNSEADVNVFVEGLIKALNETKRRGK